MRRLLAAITVFIVLIAVPSFSQMKGSSEATVKASELSPIRGVVQDNQGKPIPKAKVNCSIFLADGKLSKKTTFYADKNGRFVFRPTGESDRIYIFSASAPGFCSGRGYFSAEKSVEVIITLWPEHTITGMVVDENGAPVSGATVKVHYWQAFSNDGQATAECFSTEDQPIQAVTGEDGRFNLKGVSNPDDFEFVYARMSVTQKGRATINKPFEKDGLEGEIRLIQPLECILEGTLYLPGRTGTVPEGTMMAVHVFSETFSEHREAPVGKDGRFRFGELPPGKAHIMLASRNLGNIEYTPSGETRTPKPITWALPAVDLELTPQQPKVIDLELTQGALIKGTVVDKTSGKPIGKARLRVEHAGKSKGVTPDYTYTDEKGEFSARVAAGDVSVSVEEIGRRRFEGNETSSTSFKVADGDEKSDIVIKIDPAQSRGIYDVMRQPVPDDFEIRSGTYRLAWDPELSCLDSVSFTIELSGDQVAQKLKGAPKWRSDKPRLTAYRFDGPGDEGLLVFAEDESGGSGKGYDTVYVDRNRNWDLSDDEPVHMEPIRRKYQQVLTEWTDVQSREGPIKVRLEIYSPDGSERYTTLQKTGGWKGTVETNKGTVECALVDSNVNGVYGDAWKWHEDGQPDVWGDYVYIDSNGFGRVVLTGWSPHRVRLDPICMIGSQFYRFRVDATDNTEVKITVEPYTGPMGSLVVRGENIEGLEGVPERVYVASRDGRFDIKSVSEQPVALPVGSYRLVGCDMVLKSKSPRKLRLGCQLSSAFDVKPDETTVVAVSGKLSLAINPNIKEMVWKPGKLENLEWMMKIGDNATLYSIGRNDPQFSPKIKFFNRKGELLYTTTAGYT